MNKITWRISYTINYLLNCLFLLGIIAFIVAWPFEFAINHLFDIEVSYREVFFTLLALMILQSGWNMAKCVKCIVHSSSGRAEVWLAEEGVRTITVHHVKTVSSRGVF